MDVAVGFALGGLLGGIPPTIACAVALQRFRGGVWRLTLLPKDGAASSPLLICAAWAMIVAPVVLLMAALSSSNLSPPFIPWPLAVAMGIVVSLPTSQAFETSDAAVSAVLASICAACLGTAFAIVAVFTYTAPTPGLLTIGITTVSFWVLYAFYLMRWERKRRWRAQDCCDHCGYPRSTILIARCPECGRGLTPPDRPA